MLENPAERKLVKLLEITNISDDKVEKLNYKEKQKYFKAKSQLKKICFFSRDSEGKGITYKKKKGD